MVKSLKMHSSACFATVHPTSDSSRKYRHRFHSNLYLKSVYIIVTTATTSLFKCVILGCNIGLWINSSSRFLFQDIFPAYYFMCSIHFLVHLSTLPILIKSSLHSDVFANFGWWIHHCLFIKADWKQGIHYVVPDNLFISLSQGTAIVASLLSSSFYKYCVLSQLICTSSIVFMLGVTKFLSFLLSYKMLA